MEGLGIAIIVPVVIALVVIAIVLESRARAKRRAELASLAAEMGWSFAPGRDRSHDDRHAQFEVFRRGHSRVAYNTLRGRLRLLDRDWPATMGDFEYKITTSNGKSTTTRTYRFSYLLVRLPFRAVPDLMIRREGLFDKLAGALGFDDIDFESEQFSRAFHVKSRDRRFAYDVITPRMMEFLLSPGTPVVDIEREECCLADGKRLWSASGFRATIGWAGEFFSQWPEHLVRDLADREAGG